MNCFHSYQYWGFRIECGRPDCDFCYGDWQFWDFHDSDDEYGNEADANNSDPMELDANNFDPTNYGDDTDDYDYKAVMKAFFT